MTDNCGIYIHTPFCAEKCHYCSFYSIPVKGDDDRIDFYKTRLLEEIEQWCSGRSAVKADTVYFGGGTPSLLGGKGIRLILEFIRKKFNLSGDCEITIEMNPDHLTRDNLQILTGAGVNRIVLGVQTLNSEMRNVIGRRGKLCIRADLDLFFSCGDFTRSIDIIGGLPGQRWKDLACDIDTISLYMPDHISLYLLSVEAGTPLFKRFKTNDNFESLQLSLWEKTIEMLKRKGYEHYEISNFAFNGAYSRHNMKYWTFQPYIGFGPGAHSFYENRRFSNKSDLAGYLSRPEAVSLEESRTSSDAAVEFIMTSLRLITGFRPKRFREVAGYDLPEEIMENLIKLKGEGLIKNDGELYRVSSAGLPLFDSIVYRITEPLL